MNGHTCKVLQVSVTLQAELLLVPPVRPFGEKGLRTARRFLSISIRPCTSTINEDVDITVLGDLSEDGLSNRRAAHVIRAYDESFRCHERYCRVLAKLGEPKNAKVGKLYKSMGVRSDGRDISRGVETDSASFNLPLPDLPERTPYAGTPVP